MNGFVKADICRQVSVCLRVFCGILFAFKPFRDYSLCSVCILPQPAFYSQSAVCILPLVRSLHFTLTEYTMYLLSKWKKIQNAEEYSYPGTTFSSNGNFSTSKQRSIEKTRRSIFACMQAIAGL